MLRVQVDVRGPLFDGRLERQISAATDEARDEVADEGVNLMHASADQFKNPTGAWESQLQTDRSVDDVVIHDLAIYNDWLEGVSSRNQATRFKGYRMWRLAGQKLQDLAGPIVEAVFRRRLD